MEPAPPIPAATSAPATPTSAGWMTRVARFKRPLVAIAGVGAVLSGLAGWWNALSTVRTAAHAIPATVAVSTATPSSTAPLSVVVMPFANLTGDPHKGYVADGLTASLTTDLARVPEAFIVPVATALAYRDKGLTVQQLGQTLGVNYVLSGSVTGSGNGWRIDAQLADARSGAQVWSRSFDGAAADLASLQDRVLREVAAGAGNSMATNVARDSEKRTGNPTVADLRLRVWAMAFQAHTKANFEREIALLRQALALQPDDPRLQIDLALRLRTLANDFERGDRQRDRRKQLLVEAHQLAVQASASEPDNASACLLNGSLASIDREPAVARRILEHCLELRPNSSAILNELAITYTYDGPEGTRKAIDMLRRAIELEGSHPAGPPELNLGEALFVAGDSAGAIESLRTTVRQMPQLTEAWWYLAMAYADVGDQAHLDEAKAKIAALRAAAPDAEFASFHEFEESNSVDTPGYRTLRDTRVLPLWRKAGLPM